MYISPHMLVNCPEVLHYEPSSINMGCFCNISWHANSQPFAAWSLRQKRTTSMSSRWQVFSSRNMFSLNPATEYMFILFIIVPKYHYCSYNTVKKVINHVKTEMRMLYCILPLYHHSSVMSEFRLYSCGWICCSYIALCDSAITLCLCAITGCVCYQLWLICLKQAVSTWSLQ